MSLLIRKRCIRPKHMVIARAIQSLKRLGLSALMNSHQLAKHTSKNYLLISIEKKELSWKYIEKETFKDSSQERNSKRHF